MLTLHPFAKTSGLYYSWDPARPAGARIVEACELVHEPLDAARIVRADLTKMHLCAAH